MNVSDSLLSDFIWFLIIYSLREVLLDIPLILFHNIVKFLFIVHCFIKFIELYAENDEPMMIKDH